MIILKKHNGKWVRYSLLKIKRSFMHDEEYGLLVVMIIIVFNIHITIK